jgi:hypothetical protein
MVTDADRRRLDVGVETGREHLALRAHAGVLADQLDLGEVVAALDRLLSAGDALEALHEKLDLVGVGRVTGGGTDLDQVEILECVAHLLGVGLESAQAWWQLGCPVLRLYEDLLRLGLRDRQRGLTFLAAGAASGKVVGDAEGGVTLRAGEVDHPPAV